MIDFMRKIPEIKRAFIFDSSLVPYHIYQGAVANLVPISKW